MKFGPFIIATLLLATAAVPGYAQEDDAVEEITEDTIAPEPPAEEGVEEVVEAPDQPSKPAFLVQENEGRSRTNRIGALVLGGWALGNFTWATVGLLREPEERGQAFHLTNAAINLVVAGMSVTTYFANLPQDDWETYDTIRTLNEAHSTEKLYLLSTGLDFAYIATGAFLTAKGNLDRKEGMVGTGKSLMVQGAFLAAFDIAMFTMHWLRRTGFVAKLTGTGE